MAAILPSIVLPSGIDAGLVRYLAAIKDIIEVRDGLKGDDLDAHLTYRDLVDAGIVTATDYIGSGDSTIKPKVITPPPVIPLPLAQLAATGQKGSVCLTWSDIGSVNHAFVEIWRTVNANDIGTAELIDVAPGQLYLDYDVTPGQQYWYYLRDVSNIGIAGPFNEDAVTATPTEGAETLVDQLVDAGGFAVPGQPYFYVPPGGIVVNGEDIPEGTYIWNFVLANATIKGAQIKNAVLNSGHFQSLDASKIEFNQATGKRFESVVITGGLIQGMEIIAEEIIGGLIRGTNITSGGTEDLPAIELDGLNGTLRSNSALENPSVNDSFNFVELGLSTIRTGMYVPGFGQAIDQVLSRIETGISNSNEVVTLPGYWKTVPEIMVVPQELTMPDPATDLGDKRMKCSATNIERVSSNPNTADYYKVRFKPTALINSESGFRSVPVLSSLWDYSDNTLRDFGLNYLAGAGSRTTPNFLVPQSAESVEVTTTCTIYEWLDLNGSNYVFATGSVYFQFFISDNGGSTWNLVGTSGAFNSGGGAGRLPSAAWNALSLRHYFNFSPSSSARLGRITYFVSQGGLVGFTDSIPGNQVVAPYARLQIRCETLKYPVAAGDNYLDGKVGWVVIR
jgi:hypothetical protein